MKFEGNVQYKIIENIDKLNVKKINNIDLKIKYCYSWKIDGFIPVIQLKKKQLTIFKT